MKMSTLQSPRASDPRRETARSCQFIASAGYEIGLISRITIIKGHALSEYYIGPSDQFSVEQVIGILKEYYDQKMAQWGISYGDLPPYSKGEINKGWELKNVQYVKVGQRWTSPNLHWKHLGVYEQDGEIWVNNDNLWGRYTSSMIGYIEDGRASARTNQFIEQTSDAHSSDGTVKKTVEISSLCLSSETFLSTEEERLRGLGLLKESQSKYSRNRLTTVMQPQHMRASSTNDKDACHWQHVHA